MYVLSRRHHRVFFFHLVLFCFVTRFFLIGHKCKCTRWPPSHYPSLLPLYVFHLSASTNALFVSLARVAVLHASRRPLSARSHTHTHTLFNSLSLSVALSFTCISLTLFASFFFTTTTTTKKKTTTNIHDTHHHHHHHHHHTHIERKERESLLYIMFSHFVVVVDSLLLCVVVVVVALRN